MSQPVLQNASHDPIAAQEGVLTYAQAIVMYSRAYIRNQLSSARWQRPVRGVIVLHNGPPTAGQLEWVALLSCPVGSVLGGLSALARDGFSGFEPESPTIVIPHGGDFPRRDGLIVHCSTMMDSRDVHPLRIPPRTRPQRSLIDEASWTPFGRRARAIILAGAQQGLAAPEQMREALPRRGSCRNLGLIAESIEDAAGGIQSLPEHEFSSIPGEFGLPEPTRQSIVRRANGTYYLDARWDAYDAACEIHGIPHMSVVNWNADLFRANEVVIAGPRLLIFSSYAIRRERPVVGQQLRQLLRRGGFRG
ncbi:hypothetical protein BH09ACT10_BH09ACT10_22100 [soil metagenome]